MADRNDGERELAFQPPPEQAFAYRSGVCTGK
jgi:hypothetical protein